MVGRVPVYLLDTDLEQNDPADRELSHRLYRGSLDLRLRQEWILGVGGVRVLRALGQRPAAWHANEGHAAFMLLERVREQVAQGGCPLARQGRSAYPDRPRDERRAPGHLDVAAYGPGARRAARPRLDIPRGRAGILGLRADHG